MDKVFVSKVSALLSNREGRPINEEDIYQYLTSQGYPIASMEDLKIDLHEMYSKGFIYPYQGYWYPTYHSEVWGAANITPDSKNNFRYPNTQYSPFLTDYNKVKPETRDKYKEEWKDKLSKYYDYFKKSHPEYNNFFKWVDQSTPNYYEFIKDAMAIFLQMNMEHNSIKYPGTQYSIPEELSAIEHAMNEAVYRLTTFMKKEHGAKVIPPDVYRKAYDNVAALSAEIQSKFILEVISTSPSGTIISADAVKKFTENSLKKNLPKEVSPDFFLNVIEGKLSNLKHSKEKGVFLYNTPATTIANYLQNSLLKDPAFVSTWNTFMKTKSGFQGKADQITTNVWSDITAPGTDFFKEKGLDLEKVTISDSNFSNCNFTNADLTGASITNCNLRGSLFKESVFKPSTFTGNDITKMDVDGAVLGKAIPWDENKGQPINLVYREVSYDKKDLDNITKSPQVYSYAFPLSEAEEEDALNLVYALKGYLDSLQILSFKDDDFGLTKTSSLSDNEIASLKNWLESSENVPNIEVDDLKKWLADKNKSGELAEAGFNKKDINLLFGRASTLISGPKKSPSEVARDKRKELSQNFANAYGGKDSIPKTALLGVLTNTEGNLHDWLQDLPDKVAYKDIFNIYHALLSSLKQFHLTSGATTLTRKYEHLPYTTYVTDLSDTERNVSGKGTQFGVTLVPIYSLMPNGVAEVAQRAVREGTTHMYEGLAFSRIFPMIYHEIRSGSKGKIFKKVWAISEMQSDSYQKSGKSEDADEEGDERKNIHSEYYETGAELDTAMKNFRRYVHHWPENLLNAIIELAQKHNVDEIWMPTGKDVAKKTGKGEYTQEAWYKYYDRPAKTFGGKLKNVGADISLDPGSSYSHKRAEWYVIPIKKPTKEGSLNFSSQDPSFKDYDTTRNDFFMYDKDQPSGNDSLDRQQSYDTDLMYLKDTDKEKKERDSLDWTGRENLQLGFGSLKLGWQLLGDISVGNRVKVEYPGGGVIIDIIREDDLLVNEPDGGFMCQVVESRNPHWDKYQMFYLPRDIEYPVTKISSLKLSWQEPPKELHWYDIYIKTENGRLLPITTVYTADKEQALKEGKRFAQRSSIVRRIMNYEENYTFVVKEQKTSSLKFSNDIYFDSTPSEDTIPEERNFTNPLPDKKLRRTDPKIYDRRHDWYSQLPDSEVSNRYDNSIPLEASLKLGWRTTPELGTLDALKNFISTMEPNVDYKFPNYPYKRITLDYEDADNDGKMKYSWSLTRNWDFLPYGREYTFPTHGNMVVFWSKRQSVEKSLYKALEWLYDESTGELSERWRNKKTSSLKLGWQVQKERGPLEWGGMINTIIEWHDNPEASDLFEDTFDRFYAVLESHGNHMGDTIDECGVDLFTPEELEYWYNIAKEQLSRIKGGRRSSLKLGWQIQPDPSDMRELASILSGDGWKYAKDLGTGHYYLENNRNHYIIHLPYNFEKDDEGFREEMGLEADPGKKWMIQLSNSLTGNIDMDWTSTVIDAAQIIKQWKQEYINKRDPRNSSLKFSWSDRIPETANDLGITTNRGNIIWSEKFSIPKGKSYFGGGKFIAYIEEDSKGKIGGVIDMIGGDTVWGDEYPSVEVAKKELRKEMKAMLSNADWWNEGGVIGSLKFSDLQDYPWDEIKYNLKHHFNYVINENRRKFPDIEKYVSDEMMAQFAYKTFFTEYNLPGTWRGDPEFADELKRIIKDDLGYTIYSPPYIDWFYWLQKAWDDIRYFLKNQRENIAPDMNVSDQELARDWLNLWQEEKQVPMDIQRAVWYHSVFLKAIQTMFEDKGLGDILGTEYQAPQSPEERTEQILRPDTGVNEDEGDIPVDREGNPLPKDEDIWAGTNYKPPKEEPKEEAPEADSDTLLDELHDAILKGDDARADEIKKKLNELQSRSSLHFGWQLQSEEIKDWNPFFEEGVCLVNSTLPPHWIIRLKREGKKPTFYGRVKSFEDAKRDGRTLALELNIPYVISPMEAKEENNQRNTSLKLGWQVQGYDIKDITFDTLSKVNVEGLVMLGAGGDLNEWIEGVTQSLNEEKIAKGTPENLFSNFYRLTSTGGRTDLVMTFKEGSNINMSNLAMWRLQMGDCSWISDYIVNYRDHFSSLKLSWLTPDDITGGYPFIYDKQTKRLYLGDYNRIHNNIVITNQDELSDFNELDKKNITHLRYIQGRVNDDGDRVAFWEQSSPNVDTKDDYTDCIFQLQQEKVAGSNPHIYFTGGYSSPFRDFVEFQAREASLKLGWQVQPETKIEVGGIKHRILQVIWRSPDHIGKYVDIQPVYGGNFQYFSQLQYKGYVKRIAPGRYKLTPSGESILETLNGRKQSSLRFAWQAQEIATKIQAGSYTYNLIMHLYRNGGFASNSELRNAGVVGSSHYSWDALKAARAKGWIENPERGLYVLTDEGKRVCEYLKNKYQDYENERSKTPSWKDLRDSSLVFNIDKKGQENAQNSGSQETEESQKDLAEINNKTLNEETSQRSKETVIKYPTVEDIIGVHDDVIQEYGGLQGLLAGGENRIEAAIGRMQSGFGDLEFYPSVFEKAAVLCHSLISTHPFNDANKRTAFMSVFHFLDTNGFDADEADSFADIIIQVADNQADYEHLLQWVKANSKEIENTQGEVLEKLTWKQDYQAEEIDKIQKLFPGVRLIIYRNIDGMGTAEVNVPIKAFLSKFPDDADYFFNNWEEIMYADYTWNTTEDGKWASTFISSSNEEDITSSLELKNTILEFKEGE